VNAQIKAVLFEAVPSLVRAALSVAAAVAAAPVGWRTRARRERAERDDEPGGSFVQRLLAAATVADAANVLLDELCASYALELANLAWVEDDGRRAEIVAAREGRADNAAVIGHAVALDREPSGINTVVREGAAFTVYDADRSEVVNPRLNALVRAKSCVFVPVRADGQVLGAVFGGVRDPRLFADEELASMQALVDSAGPLLLRLKEAASLAAALDHERLVARISHAVRSRRKLDESLHEALEEAARATGSIRAAVRLGDGTPTSVLAEWDAPGVAAIEEPDRLPVVNLAARERRTVAVGDVVGAPELDDVTLGDVKLLVDLGVRAVLAAPIVVGERLLGVFTLQRPEPTVWSSGDAALAEAVAREVAIALDTRALLGDRDRLLAEQQALLKAAQELTSDLRFDAGIERLVEELRDLVDADAADCWILLPGGDELICRAVLGLPDTEVGRRVLAEGTIGEALAQGSAVLRHDFGRTEESPPSRAYSGFADAMVAPIVSFGDARGVLGVYSVQPGRFDESDLRLLEGFASLASIALRNAEAYEASTRQAQVERGFYRIAAVLSEPLSEQETVDAVAHAAAEALGGDSAAVLRRHGGALELVGSFQLDPRLATVLAEPEESLVACARGGKVLAATRLRDDGRFGDALARAAESVGQGSLLAVPLPEHGKDGAGAVLVFFAGQRVFEDAQLELAGQVAAAARGALERSDLYERERRARSLAQQLGRAGRELAGELDPDNVLDGAVRHACELLGADGASARVLQGDEVVVVAATGAGAPEALETRAPSTGWLVGDVVQTRVPHAAEDVRGDSRYAAADAMLAAGYAAYLGVPMAGADESAHGILAVYSRSPRSWREEEADALLALAATAAASQANAELYQGVSHEQQRSEAILANVADGIVAVDRDGHVVLWNPAAERITGVPAQEALGRAPAEALGRALEADDGGVGGSRLLPIRRGGAEVWLSLSEAVMTDPAGAIAGRIYAFRDISAERSVERMKTDFVSTVSHELRTPLTSIFGFAETLLRRDVLFGEEERETFLRYIASESERLTAIVDRLISVAQLDTGDITVQLAETDVGALVSDVVRTVEESAGENGHRFVLDLDEGLAAEADRDKLGQVLTHLLDNAVRYSPAGGTITIAARRRDDAVEVSVEDEGIGIPQAEQERIFRKFYRGETASTGAVGAGATGLGLFLAAGLIDAMGGRIRVDSSEGAGSTFVLELRASGSET
jgi:PAS domain S-box-containing protein